MLRRVSAALMRLDFRPIQRRWGLPRQISTVHAAPLAAPFSSHSDAYPLPLKKRATMARRIPPAKPDNFSDSEPDEVVNMEDFPKEMGDESLQDDEGENEDGASEVLGWMLEYNGESEPDLGPAEEEEEKENK